MVSLNVLTGVTIVALAAGASAEEPEMVWPKNKVNVTESYLPAVVQVLTYLMEDLYDLVPPSESSSESSETSDSTVTIASTAVTSESSSATTYTTESPETTSSSVTTGASPATTNATESLEATSSSATTGVSPATINATKSPEATRSSATTESSATARSESTKSSASQSEEPITEGTILPPNTDATSFLTTSTISLASTMDESSTISSSHVTETSPHTVIEEENEETSDEPTTTTEAPYVRPSLAYVMLGRLRDILANEAKRQGFSKIQGFSAEMIATLQRSSYGSSASQLRGLLCSMLNNNDIKRKESLSHSKSVLALLEKPSSFLVKILESVPPLSYTMYS